MKNKQNESYCAVQGHSRSSRTVTTESPYATSYQLLILADILSRSLPFRSFRSLLFKFLDTLRFWATLRGLRCNARCSS